MRGTFHLILYIMLAGLGVLHAQTSFATTSAGITYSGRIMKADGVTPVNSSNVAFAIAIYDVNHGCLLFTESRSIDLTNSDGTFSFDIGDGSLGTTSMFYGGITKISDLFNNKKTYNGYTATAPNKCSDGSASFTPISTNEPRVLMISFDLSDGSGVQALPPLKINPVPSALQAYHVNGYGSDNLLKVDTSVDLTNGGSLASGNAALTQTQYNEFWRLMNNPGTAYLSTVPSVTLSGDVTGTAAATTVTKLQGVEVSATTPTTGQVLTFDGTNWVAAVAAGGGSSTSLASGKIWVGNSGGAASAVTLSGDASLSNAGSLTIASGAVTSAKILDGTINSADMDFTGAVTANSGLVLADASTGKFNNFACSAAGEVPTWTFAGWSCATPSASAVTSGDVTAALGYTPVNRAGDTMSGILSVDNGDGLNAFTKAQIAFGWNGTSQFAHYIHTRHNSGAGNAIDFYTSDGTASGTFPTNAVQGLSIVDGSVGIGTTSPTQKLTVAGIIESTSGGIKFPDGTTQTTAASSSGVSGTANYVTKFTSSTAVGNSQIYDNGSVVGIGLTPDSLNTGTKLRTTGIQFGNSVTFSNQGFSLVEAPNVDGSTWTTATAKPFAIAGGVSWINFNETDIGGDRAGNAASNRISFFTDSTFNGTGTERMRIDQNGNVGIGTANPQSPMTIANGTDQQGLEIQPGSSQIRIFGYDHNNGAYMPILFDNSSSKFTGSIEIDGQLQITSGTPALGKVLTSDGSGIATWAAPAGASPSGSANEVQYRSSATAFGSSASFVFDSSNGGMLGIGLATPRTTLNVRSGTHAIMLADWAGGTWNNQHQSLSQAPSSFDDSLTHKPYTLIGGNSYLDRSEAMIGGSLNLDETAVQYVRFFTDPNRDTLQGQERMTIDPNGNIGIGTTSPGYKLDVQGGGVNASGGYTQTSDIRLKTNIEFMDSEKTLRKIASLRGINYNWKETAKLGGDRQIGLIAQDVQKVFPEAVKQNQEGFLSVSYSNLVAPLIESLKQLLKVSDIHTQEIAAIKAADAEKDEKIKKLESENAAMKERLDRIEKALGQQP